MSKYCKCCKEEIQNNDRDYTLCAKCLCKSMFGTPEEYFELARKTEKQADQDRIKELEEEVEYLRGVISGCQKCQWKV